MGATNASETAVRHAVRALLAAVGLAEASRRLRVTREVVAAIAAGLPSVRANTLAVVRLRLAELEAPRGAA